jgi:hypothetical protein
MLFALLDDWAPANELQPVFAQARCAAFAASRKSLAGAMQSRATFPLRNEL